MKAQPTWSQASFRLVIGAIIGAMIASLFMVLRESALLPFAVTVFSIMASAILAERLRPSQSSPSWASPLVDAIRKQYPVVGTWFAPNTWALTTLRGFALGVVCGSAIWLLESTALVWLDQSAAPTATVVVMAAFYGIVGLRRRTSDFEPSPVAAALAAMFPAAEQFFMSSPSKAVIWVRSLVRSLLVLLVRTILVAVVTSAASVWTFTLILGAVVLVVGVPELVRDSLGKLKGVSIQRGDDA